MLNSNCVLSAIAFSGLLLGASEPSPHSVRATGVIRAVRSQTILVPRIEGLGGNLTLATLAENGALVSPGDSLATFDRANEIKLLLEAQTKFDDLGHQIEQQRATNNSNAEKRIADLQQAQADLKKAEIESRKGPVLSAIDQQKNQVKLEDSRAHVVSLEKSSKFRDGKLSLTVRSFLELVLRNSTDVNLTRLDVYTANASILAAKAPYDPVVGLGFNTLRSVSPSVSQISGASTLSTLTQNSTVQYQQLLSTGQTVSAGYTASRSSDNSAFNLLNPSLFSTFSFTAFQPLLQDRSRIQVRGPLEIARTQLTVTSRTGEAHIADLLATAAVEYWSAVQARDNVKVLQQTLDLAQKSYARDKQALDLGALAQLDIYQSESQVAGRKRDLIQADYTYKANVDSLRRLMGADLTPALRAVEIVLEDDPASLPSKTTVLPYEEALSAAMRVRPELDAAHRAVTVDEINAKIARNLLLPRLDLSVQVQSVGLGGNQVAIAGPLGITTPAMSGGIGESLGQLFSVNTPSYGAGLQLTLPFRSSAARAQLAQVLVNRTRDQYNERQAQEQIAQDVRSALNSIDLADATVQAAIVARDLAQKNVDAEQQKYELGTVTAFELLDSQTQLATSESALLGAHVGYQQAYVAYQRATWTLLDGLGMVLETPKVN
jgi:outer membrane protein TolC